MPKTIYYHELSDNKFHMLQKSGITWEELAKKHPQPVWCKYPDAIIGELGCWALVAGNIRKESDCAGCDYKAVA